ncbi:hypothetical protein N7931_15605 [Catenovulum sp. 2E275]|uniref:hypothetical protein n=1 Tax=Catenovulum sp. 2E275 TaxID=2980497 RepID=UPI0021D1FCD4|nr:hypothetical protein [Catenovulum sp. 2E275]MCU4677059.1 hypothetical protein [Catenovulum sp. 2E275]
MANDKRGISLTSNQWWDELSMAQKFSANSLFQFGYQLAFIRNTEAGKLAVLIRDGQIVAISEDGELDAHPDIVLRESRDPKSENKN